MVQLIEVVTSKGREEEDLRVYGQHSKSEEDAKKGLPPVSIRGNLFLVLEFVDHDLSGLLDVRYEFTPVVIKSIFYQLLDVMKYIHGHNYVHRDIKCSNLLINGNHQLKLADFGLARKLKGADEEMTNKVVTLW